MEPLDEPGAAEVQQLLRQHAAETAIVPEPLE